MDLYINTPCRCIIDDEPNVIGEKAGKVEVEINDNKIHIISGINRELTFDKIILKSVEITVKGVNLTIDRSICHKMLKISVCKGSSVWMKNFFDVFPKMIFHSEGCIQPFNYDGRYIVGNLTICMNPDYSNDSSVIGFQVVDRLDIKYQYNGSIHGYYEKMCEVIKPDIVCTGKCARLNIKPISQSEQLKILRSRSTDSYKILANINKRNDIASICATCSEIKPCFKLNRCGHIICNTCIKLEHLNSGSNITPPYFICPVYHCQKKVMEISYLDDSDIVSDDD